MNDTGLRGEKRVSASTRGRCDNILQKQYSNIRTSAIAWCKYGFSMTSLTLSISTYQPLLFDTHINGSIMFDLIKANG